MIYIFILIVYVFTAYGITNMFVYLNGPFGIFEKIRKVSHWIHPQLGELFSCMACCSTWIGIAFSLIDMLLITENIFTPGSLLFGRHTEYWYLILLFDIGFTSGAVWILHNFEEMMERIGVYGN